MHQSFQVISKELQQGKTSCTALVEHYIQRIEAAKKLNAFLEIFKEEALHKASIIDQKIKDGTAGRLAGMVIGIKDNISYKNHRTEASSKMLNGYHPLYSATVVTRLLEEDAIILGRLNCDEFAMGGSNENSAYGPALNPYDITRVTGGSSGGSAAAVAAGLCLAALGSDTGGSVRQPAAFCGVIGFKPTYGRLSRHGLIAFGSSFDQIGVLTNTLADAALLLEIMAGKDAHDGTSSSIEVPPYSSLLESTKKFKIAVIRQCKESAGLDPEVRSLFEELIVDLKKEGHQVEEIEFPLLDMMVPAYYVLTTAEASSNLSRYSGLHFGHRTKATTNFDRSLSLSRSEGFGKEVKRRILLGTFVLSSGYYDAYYEKAQRVRRMIAEETSKIFEHFDILLSPTTPSIAFKIGEKMDPVSMYLEDIFTVHANLAGLPAVNIPAGMHSSHLPIGFQVMGNSMDEVTLLQFAKYIVKLTKPVTLATV